MKHIKTLKSAFKSLKIDLDDFGDRIQVLPLFFYAYLSECVAKFFKNNKNFFKKGVDGSR